MHKDIDQAIQVLHEGGIILYPTDTIWGIGCDATNEEAVQKVYQLKERQDSKSMLVLLNSATRLSQYIEEIPEVAWELLDVADKPMTIIYPGAKNLAKNLIAEDGSIGIRIVSDDFCQKLLARFKKPLVSTSANLSGRKSPPFFSAIDQRVIEGVDFTVTYGQSDESISPPSSIIRIGTGGTIEILRK